MTSAAESSELFLSDLGSPMHSMLPKLGMYKVTFDTNLSRKNKIKEMVSCVITKFGLRIYGRNNTRDAKTNETEEKATSFKVDTQMHMG